MEPALVVVALARLDQFGVAAEGEERLGQITQEGLTTQQWCSGERIRRRHSNYNSRLLCYLEG